MTSSWVRTVTAAAALAVVAAFLPACSGGSEVSGPRAEVGRNFDEHLAVEKVLAGATHRSSVQLPRGRLQLGVDTALTAVRVADPEDGTKTISMLPPRSGSLVRVAWRLEPGGGAVVIDGRYGLPKRSLTDDYDTITLIAGGTRYTLDSGDNGSGTTAWSVPGDGKDARVEVTFDGVAQTVVARTGTRSVGRAAPLYGQPAARAGNCGSPQYAAPFSPPPDAATRPRNFTCDYQVRRVGYVAGKGWAPTGKVWLVVDLDLDHPYEVALTRTGVTDSYSFAFGDELTATLYGQAGAAAQGKFRDLNGYALYFPVPLKTTLPAALTVTHELSVVPTADRNERDRVKRPLVLTYTVPLS